MSAALVSGDGLGMARGARILFQDISLAVNAGEAVVLRGANGAGKTTLLRVLAGLTRPLTGSVHRAGDHHWFGHREGLKPHETPAAHLELWAKAWGQGDVDTVVTRMGLSRPRDVPARMLSAGQRRRAALGRLLLVGRPVWLLDEPFSALDADGRALVLDLVSEHRASGGAVIAAIHGEAGFDATRELVL